MKDEKTKCKTCMQRLESCGEFAPLAMWNLGGLYRFQNGLSLGTYDYVNTMWYYQNYILRGYHFMNDQTG